MASREFNPIRTSGRTRLGILWYLGILGGQSSGRWLGDGSPSLFQRRDSSIVSP